MSLSSRNNNNNNNKTAIPSPASSLILPFSSPLLSTSPSPSSTLPVGTTSAATQARALALATVSASERSLSSSGSGHASTVLHLLYRHDVHSRVMISSESNMVMEGDSLADIVATFATTGLLGAQFKNTCVCACDYIPGRIIMCVMGVVQRRNESETGHGEIYVRVITMKWGAEYLSEEEEESEGKQKGINHDGIGCMVMPFDWRICEDSVTIAGKQ